MITLRTASRSAASTPVATGDELPTAPVRIDLTPLWFTLVRSLRVNHPHRLLKNRSPTIPGVTKYTNNTGWVKFITTPVIGTVWVIGEDTIDRYITGPIEDAHPTRLAPKILRGGLNPCRSAANAMRLKLPWYRDYEHPETMNSNAVHFISEREMLVRRLPRFEIVPHFNALSLPINTSQCAPCRNWTTGAGVGFSYRFRGWLDFDSDLSHQPDASPLTGPEAASSAGHSASAPGSRRHATP